MANFVDVSADSRGRRWIRIEDIREIRWDPGDPNTPALGRKGEAEQPILIIILENPYREYRGEGEGTQEVYSRLRAVIDLPYTWKGH